MAEKTSKIILETEYRTTGDVSGSVSKLDQLGKEAVAAQSDIIKLVEAEKKLEQAANVAGTAVQTESKKVSEFSKTVKGAGDAMNNIGQANKLKDAFKVTGLDQFNVKLKEFQKNVIAAGLSGKSLDSEVDKLVDSLGNLSKEDADQALKALGDEAKRLEKLIATPTSRLRELKRLMSTSDDPELLKQLQIEAAKLQDELQDTNDLVRALASDSFATDTLVQGVETATGVFAAFQGVVGLSSDNQEAFAEASAKAQSALALLQGVQTVINNLKKEDNIITRGQIIAQRAYAVVVGQSTGAMKGFRIALAATGIGLLVIGIAALVQNWDRLRDAITGTNAQSRLNNEITKTAIENYAKEAGSIEVAKSRLQDSNTTQAERVRIVEELQQQYPSYLGNLNAETASYEEIEAALNKVNAALLVKAKIDAAQDLLTDKIKEKLRITQLDLAEGLSFADQIEAGIVSTFKGVGAGIDNASQSVKENIGSIDGDIERLLNTIVGFNQELTTLGGDPNQGESKAAKNVQKSVKEVEKVLDGSVEALQVKVQLFRDRLLKGTVIGTSEFNAALDLYKKAVSDYNAANELIDPKPIENIVAGSLNALRKQVTDLRAILDSIPAYSAEAQAAADAVAEAEKALSDAEKSLSRDKIAEVKSNLLEILSEEERHQLKMADIDEKGEKERLEIMLFYAQKRLAVLEKDKTTSEETLLNAQNVVKELQAEISKAGDDTDAPTKFQKFTEDYADNIQLLVNTTINALQTFVGIAKAANDQLISLQEKRVDEALKIADRGNVALLVLEQERLDELNRKRAVFVKRQQQLAAIQLVSESLIAIAKAAAQGGAAAPFTIAATLIALAAGLAQARATAQAASFKKGGVYDSRGGFTGYGPTSGQSLKLGAKDYDYHYQEHIMPAPVTMLGKNKDWLERIRVNKIDIGKMMAEKNAVINLNAQSSNTEIVEVLRDLNKRIVGTKIYFDPNGVITTVEQSARQKRKIKSRIG